MNDERKYNPIAVVVLLGTAWWTLVYFFGIFQVVVWSIVITALFALSMRLKEDLYR